MVGISGRGPPIDGGGPLTVQVRGADECGCPPYDVIGMRNR